MFLFKNNMATKIIFDINSEEGEEDRTTISINGIGEVVLVETYPEYEFLDDVDEDALEELNLSTEDVIGKIEHLEIKDKFKGQGYAKLLMKKAIAVAKEKGLMPLYLNASPMGSKRYGLDVDDLTGFYESLGFEVFLQQGGNNLMILKDTYKTGGKTKNKIMENKIKFSKEEQKDFNFWKQDGNVSKNEDGSYSTQDAQWTNRLKDLDALKEYYFKEFLNGSRYAGGGTTSKLKVLNVRDIKVGDKIYARWNDSSRWQLGTFKGETKNGFEVYDFTIERPEYIEFYAQISKLPHPYGDEKTFYSKNFKDRNYKNYHFIKEIQQGNYKKGGRTVQNIAKKQARKDIKTHFYKPQFPDVSSIKPSEKWARYELPYDTKLQYDFEPDSFSVQDKRYSEYADGGEIKVNGMTKEDYIDAFQNRVEKLIQELKEEGTYDKNTFDFLYEIIEKGRDGGFTDIEETGFWLSDGDNRLAYYLSFDKNVGYRDYTDKVLSHFYFGKPMKIEFVLKTSGDTELAFEDELQKIKLLSNKIDFNKVVGVIDYEKTKNNTDLDFYKNIELVMSLNGDWDETTEELDTIIDVNGETAYLNYHPLDSMGGVNMQQLKKNINEAFKELNTYSAVVSIEGYEEYAEDVEGLENAKSVIQNIKGNTRFQVLKGSSVGIGKRVDNSRVVEEYAKGGEAGFDDTGTSMVMYHEKKGNFFVAKDTVYLWFYNVENSAEKIESGEFDYVLYPFSSLGMMGQKGFIPPLKKIWTKKFQKKTKGSEHLLGVIKAFLIEEKGKKELYIDMMSVNPTKKKKGVMSYMIKDLRDTFDLTQEQITFSDLTDEGKKFLAKKTYDDGGGIGDEGKLKFEDLVGKYFEIELGSSGTSTEWESKELLAYLKKVVTHNLFDSEFYYNWTDSDEKKQYLDIFTNDTLNEIFKNVTNALNKYFEFKTTAYSTNTKVLVFKYSNDFRDDWIDNWFKTNKKISVKLKVDYKRYREKYAGVTPYADGGNVPHADKMFQLPLEMVIYVPSTQNVNKVISIDDMILRVDEVKKYLANKFGGYTSADKLGGYVDSTGNLVNEDVVQVTSFSTKEAYAENKEQLINQLAKWCDEWGQESIGFEFEGDLMYVPNKFKKGGETKNM